MPQMQAQAQPMPQEGSPEGGANKGTVSGLLTSVGKGLGMVSQMMQKVPDVPPELKDRMSALMEEYSAIIGELSSGGAQQPMNGQAPETGGSPSAVPAGPQVRS